MSRVMTPPLTQPSNSPQLKIPHEKIAQRAYEKWIKRGRPHGSDVVDWIEAENELRSEMMRTSAHPKG